MFHFGSQQSSPNLYYFQKIVMRKMMQSQLNLNVIIFSFYPSSRLAGKQGGEGGDKVMPEKENETSSLSCLGLNKLQFNRFDHLK